MFRYKNNASLTSGSRALGISLVFLLCISCSKEGNDSIKSEIVPTAAEQQQAEETAPPLRSLYNINAFPLTKLVCDPFDPNQGPTPKHGIKSSLWFKGFNQPIYHSVLDFILNYKKSEQNLFFNSVNVPTRMFYNGFPLEAGDVVRDDLGTQLIEYFAMKFESQITLGEGDSEGLYELAILSDDGAILKIKEPNPNGVLPTPWETHINNDGDTPTRMKCSSRVIDMRHGKKIPMELLYYQGPRFHIANMLIWRKASIAGQDSLCGQSGNSLFFNPNNNSSPVKWNDLKARGWNALQSTNYLLPANVGGNTDDGEVNYNACFQGTVPIISSFQIIEQLSDEVSFSWNTNILAISQMLIVNLDTGEKKVTQTDNILRNTHQIKVSGLNGNTNYRFQVIAISEDLGRAISSAIDIKTF